MDTVQVNVVRADYRSGSPHAAAKVRSEDPTPRPLEFGVNQERDVVERSVYISSPGDGADIVAHGANFTFNRKELAKLITSSHSDPVTRIEFYLCAGNIFAEKLPKVRFMCNVSAHVRFHIERTQRIRSIVTGLRLARRRVCLDGLALCRQWTKHCKNNRCLRPPWE